MYSRVIFCFFFISSFLFLFYSFRCCSSCYFSCSFRCCFSCHFRCFFPVLPASLGRWGVFVTWALLGALPGHFLNHPTAEYARIHTRKMTRRHVRVSPGHFLLQLLPLLPLFLPAGGVFCDLSATWCPPRSFFESPDSCICENPHKKNDPEACSRLPRSFFVATSAAPSAASLGWRGGFVTWAPFGMLPGHFLLLLPLFLSCRRVNFVTWALLGALPGHFLNHPTAVFARILTRKMTRRHVRGSPGHFLLQLLPLLPLLLSAGGVVL